MNLDAPQYHSLRIRKIIPPLFISNVVSFKGRVTSSISSREIEEEYLRYDASTPTEISFSTITNKYTLDLQSMTQKNVVYKTERQVRRRPEFYVMKEKTTDADVDDG